MILPSIKITSSDKMPFYNVIAKTSGYRSFHHVEFPLMSHMEHRLFPCYISFLRWLSGLLLPIMAIPTRQTTIAESKIRRLWIKFILIKRADFIAAWDLSGGGISELHFTAEKLLNTSADIMDVLTLVAIVKFAYRQCYFPRILGIGTYYRAQDKPRVHILCDFITRMTLSRPMSSFYAFMTLISYRWAVILVTMCCLVALGITFAIRCLESSTNLAAPPAQPCILWPCLRGPLCVFRPRPWARCLLPLYLPRPRVCSVVEYYLVGVCLLPYY